MEFVNYTPDETHVGVRIDVYLANVTDDTRNSIQNKIQKEKIKVNNKIVKSNYKIRKNDIIQVAIEEPKSVEIIPTKMELDIVYEDTDIVIVNKSQGVVVHPAPGHYDDTLVNGLMYHCDNLSGINGELRPGIVHRIDRDTSGIIVIAKNDMAHNLLSKQLQDHSMTREYYAIVHGNIKEDTGTINKPIGRHKLDRKKMCIREDGRNAITHFEVIERLKGYTLVKLKLETGRTHQIRVHMASVGHPLLGDSVYCNAKNNFKLEGQTLHAKVLGFVHPATNEYVEFTSELPTYFENILKKLR